MGELLSNRGVEDAAVAWVMEGRAGRPVLFNLRVLGGERLQRLLLRVKEQRFYAMPWPVAEYDSCPLGLID